MAPEPGKTELVAGPLQHFHRRPDPHHQQRQHRTPATGLEQRLVIGHPQIPFEPDAPHRLEHGVDALQHSRRSQSVFRSPRPVSRSRQRAQSP